MGKTLKEIHDVFPVISLTGPRQSGKTTLCRHLYPDIPYINMENIHTANLFLEDPVGYGGIIYHLDAATLEHQYQ